MSETTPSDMAAALQTFDEATGLTRYHDRGLADPYASSMSKASSAWSADIDGRLITEDDLRKEATVKKIAGYLGSGFAKQFLSSPGQIFDSLPTPEQVLIKQIVSGEA